MQRHSDNVKSAYNPHAPRHNVLFMPRTKNTNNTPIRAAQQTHPAKDLGVNALTERHKFARTPSGNTRPRTKWGCGLISMSDSVAPRIIRTDFKITNKIPGPTVGANHCHPADQKTKETYTNWPHGLYYFVYYNFAILYSLYF